jgi:hypothetical protein
MDQNLYLVFQLMKWFQIIERQRGRSEGAVRDSQDRAALPFSPIVDHGRQ